MLAHGFHPWLRGLVWSWDDDVQPVVVWCPSHRLAMSFEGDALIRPDVRDLRGRFITSPPSRVKYYSCPKGEKVFLGK